MKKSLLIMVAMIPLAVLAAQAGSDSFSATDTDAQWGGLRVQGSRVGLAGGSSSSVQKNPSAAILIAHSAADKPDKNAKSPGNGGGSDLDLRYVDWDSMKADKKGKTVKNGNGKNGDNGEENGNGDEEDENGEDEKEEKNGEDEKDETSGWDRVWDAPKLG